MAEFLSPGVFTEEVASGESVILGVSTSNYATVGWTPRGIENKATLVTSLQDYFRKFGGYWKNSDVPLAVTAFFKNDGARAYIVRVTPEDAVAAEGSIPKWAVKAISKGKWGDSVRVVIRGNDNFRDVATAIYSRFDIEIQEESSLGAGDFATTETFEAVSLDDTDDASYLLDVINDDENGSKTVRFVEGVSGAGVPDEFIPSAVTGEALATADGAEDTFAGDLLLPVVSPFTLKLMVDGSVVAVDNGRGRLALGPGAVDAGITAVNGTIDYQTGAYSAQFTPAPLNGAEITADYVKKGADQLSIALAGGLDGTSVGFNEALNPALEADLKGLYALNLIDEMLNIGLPDFSGDVTAQSALIDYCEGRGDCFAILDTKRGIDAQDAKNYKQVTLASLSTYAAMYYPGVKVADPLKDGRPKVMSPVGHIAGVYARTDSDRNVGKAPAGVNDGRLNYAIGLERVLSKGERDLIYPVNINPLISSNQTGRAVWGARTLAITGDFTLVNVRRLFMFLRKSVFNSTHDLVFEPIGEDLFAVVNLRLSGFMEQLTQDGYFASRVPSEAFRIVIDGSNNTAASIKSRQLITDILVAPQTPAEFVRFRFQRSFVTL